MFVMYINTCKNTLFGGCFDIHNSFLFRDINFQNYRKSSEIQIKPTVSAQN